MKKIEGISVQGSSMSNKHTTQEVKGGIVDGVEEKMKQGAKKIFHINSE